MEKTNVMRILEQSGIQYKAHEFDVSDEKLDGLTAASRIGKHPYEVFKTLVTQGDDRAYYVFVIPVEAELDLKKAAKAVGVKSVSMIKQKMLFPVTGYIHGGCSPIGMKKQFLTVFDENIILLETVTVSAGKIGKQVEIKPDELIEITNASVADLTRE